MALRFKSTKQLQQLETVYIVTDAQTSLKHRTRVVAAFNPSGKVTSAGNILSDAPLVSLTASWCMKVEDKKKLYGSMRIAVGGQTDQEQPRARPDSELEPVSFHQTCKEVWQEIMQSETQCKAVIDLNATDILAWECVQSATPYLGVTFTEFHSEALTNRLAQLTFKMMMTEGSNLYRPSLAMLLRATAGGPQQDQEGAGAKKAKKGRTKNRQKKPRKKILVLYLNQAMTTSLKKLKKRKKLLGQMQRRRKPSGLRPAGRPRKICRRDCKSSAANLIRSRECRIGSDRMNVMFRNCFC